MVRIGNYLFDPLRVVSHMPMNFLRSLSFLLFLSFPLFLFAQQSTHVVDEVVIDGNRRIDTEAIKLQIGKSSGKFTEDEISQLVRTLYETSYFDQVTAHFVTLENGKRGLEFRVVEKPSVRKVFIKGNDHVDEESLEDIFTFGPRRFLDRTKIHFLIKSAVSYYQAQGYHDADFTYSVVPVGDNQVDLTFTVDEGERYKIREISFLGVNQLDEDELLGVMQTTEYKWWSSWLFGTGRLNEEMLENDQLLIRQHFLDVGFLDATISEPAIEARDGGIYITFNVSEGHPYTIGDISVEGDLIDGSEEATLADIEIESGDTFGASKLRQSSFVISEKFTDIGYAFTNVTPNTVVKREISQIDIHYKVEKGKPVKVRKINITGNTKTYDHVIRREVRINEQDEYSSSLIRRSEVLLRRLGYFEEVNISTETTDKDDEVDLNVNVREGSTGSFSAGAGYSSSEGALFNARLSENNIFGTGRRFVINADLGDERENLVLSLQDRRIDDTFWSGGIDLIRTDREFFDFDRKLQGGSLSVGYPLGEFFGEWAEDLDFSVKYEYLTIDITNVDEADAAPLVIKSQGESTSSGFTPRLVRNTIDNPLNPTDGSRQSLSFEITGLGGSEEYYLIEARNQIYTPVWNSDFGKFVFSWRTRFGYGNTFDDDEFPLFRRYFPGGINSVRGYESRTLGPTDADGNEFGGSKQLINNFELIFPIINSAGLKGVVFYDAGEAFDDDESINFSDLRLAWGYGFRWSSPLGPIRIEFGFPIDKEPGDDSMVTLFSFGAPL